MMPLFQESPADVIHLEMTNKEFAELDAFREFPTDKVLGARRGRREEHDGGVAVEKIADRIRRASR